MFLHPESSLCVGVGFNRPLSNVRCMHHLGDARVELDLTRKLD
jgi:hypothetical protein